MAQDPGLEVGQGRRRVEPELLPQDGSEALVGPHRLGLAAKVIQRQHQLTPGPFPQRVAGDVRLEPGQGVGRPATGQFGVGEVLNSVEAGFVQASGLGSQVASVDDVAEGGAPP